MKRIQHESLVKAASSKPGGYLEEVLSKAEKIEDGWVYITADEYADLKEKYSPDEHPLEGPGKELHNILARFGLTFSKGCKCRSRMIQMNKWGAEGCESRIEEIVEWLAEEAAARNLPYLKAAGRFLVHMAIRKAKKNV